MSLATGRRNRQGPASLRPRSPWLLVLVLSLPWVPGCSRAPAPIVHAGPERPGAPPGPVQLTPAPGSRLDPAALPAVDLLAAQLNAALAPAGLRLRSVAAEAAPDDSPFGGSGSVVTIRGQLEAETAETLYRGKPIEEAAVRARGLLPLEGAPRYRDSDRHGRLGQPRYDPLRDGGPLSITVLLSPVVAAGQRFSRLFEVQAERFGPGRYEWSLLMFRPDPAAGAGAGSPRLNLPGPRYQPNADAPVDFDEGMDLPRPAFGPAAVLAGSAEETALWAAEARLKAAAEARAAAETALLRQALGPGATYRGPWRRPWPAPTGYLSYPPDPPLTLELVVEALDPATGNLRAHLSRTDPGPPGPRLTILEGKIDLDDHRGDSPQGLDADGPMAPVRLWPMRAELNGGQLNGRDTAPNTLLRISPLGVRFPVLEFTLVDRGPQPEVATPASSRFVLHYEDKMEGYAHSWEALQVSPGAGGTAAPTPVPGSNPR